MAEIHLERIAPGKCPGGIWIRICTRHQLVKEYGVTDPDVAGISALADADLVVQQNEKVWTYFYDGDSGECVGTFIAGP